MSGGRATEIKDPNKFFFPRALMKNVQLLYLLYTHCTISIIRGADTTDRFTPSGDSISINLALKKPRFPYLKSK